MNLCRIGSRGRSRRRKKTGSLNLKINNGLADSYTEEKEKGNKEKKEKDDKEKNENEGEEPQGSGA